jgi:protein SCO1/2
MKRILFLVVFFVIGVSVTYFMIRPSEKKILPILNPVDVKKEMVDPELLRIGYGHKVGDFSFLNQEGENISLNDVRGKVFVAEYFFTTCGTICPIMNQQMQRVAQAYASENDFRILSFTVDPKTDTVEQMKRYATAHGADAKKWYFLTGTQEKLYALARKSFFVLKPAEAENQGDVGSDFIHTNNFVLVDKQLRIRGYYDGTNPKEVTGLIEDIGLLLEEQ